MMASFVCFDHKKISNMNMDRRNNRGRNNLPSSGRKHDRNQRHDQHQRRQPRRTSGRIPAVQPPVAQQPAAESTAVQPPAAESPAAQPPAAESPAAQPPAAESITAQPPAAESPAAQPPAAESSAAQQQQEAHLQEASRRDKKQGHRVANFNGPAGDSRSVSANQVRGNGRGRYTDNTGNQRQYGGREDAPDNYGGGDGNGNTWYNQQYNNHRYNNHQYNNHHDNKDYRSNNHPRNNHHGINYHDIYRMNTGPHTSTYGQYNNHSQYNIGDRNDRNFPSGLNQHLQNNGLQGSYDHLTGRSHQAMNGFSSSISRLTNMMQNTSISQNWRNPASTRQTAESLLVPRAESFITRADNTIISWRSIHFSGGTAFYFSHGAILVTHESHRHSSSLLDLPRNLTTQDIVHHVTAANRRRMLLPAEFAEHPEIIAEFYFPRIGFIIPNVRDLGRRSPHILRCFAIFQISFYLSANNLSGDVLLLSLMESDGSIALEQLIRFPQINQLHLTATQLREFLVNLSHLQLVGQDRVRNRFYDAFRTTVPQVEYGGELSSDNLPRFSLGFFFERLRSGDPNNFEVIRHFITETMRAADPDFQFEVGPEMSSSGALDVAVFRRRESTEESFETLMSSTPSMRVRTVGSTSTPNTMPGSLLPPRASTPNVPHHNHGVPHHNHGVPHHNHVSHHNHDVPQQNHDVSHHNHDVSHHNHDVPHHNHGVPHHNHGVLHYNHEVPHHNQDVPHHNHGVPHHNHGVPHPDCSPAHHPSITHGATMSPATNMPSHGSNMPLPALNMQPPTSPMPYPSFHMSPSDSPMPHYASNMPHHASNMSPHASNMPALAHHRLHPVPQVSPFTPYRPLSASHMPYPFPQMPPSASHMPHPFPHMPPPVPHMPHLAPNVPSIPPGYRLEQVQLPDGSFSFRLVRE